MKHRLPQNGRIPYPESNTQRCDIQPKAEDDIPRLHEGIIVSVCNKQSYIFPIIAECKCLK